MKPNIKPSIKPSIIPTRDNILLEVPKNSGSIIYNKSITNAKVLKVGKDVKEIKIGDIVYFSHYREINNYLICSENDIYIKR